MHAKQHRLDRRRFPSGLDGEQLVIDGRTTTGLTWKPRGIEFDTPSSDTDAATKGYVDTEITAAKAYTDSEIDDLPVHSAGLAGTILGQAAAVQAFSGNLWFPCPVGGTHVLSAESSSVFTRPANQSVFRYTGTPTIIAHVVTTGNVQRTTAGAATLFLIGFGKGTTVPAHADAIGSMTLITAAVSEYYSYSVNMIVELDQNDYVAPMFNSFLSALVPHSFDLGWSQTTIRQIREA